jgi:hypothetical protein
MMLANDPSKVEEAGFAYNIEKWTLAKLERGRSEG